MFSFTVHDQYRFNVITQQERDSMKLMTPEEKARLMSADVMGQQMYIINIVTRQVVFDYISYRMGWHSYDFGLPQGFINTYQETNGKHPEGVWMYHAPHDWTGDFFSLDQALAILWGDIVKAILTGACTYETVEQYRNRKRAEWQRKAAELA